LLFFIFIFVVTAGQACIQKVTDLIPTTIKIKKKSNNKSVYIMTTNLKAGVNPTYEVSCI
jgi:hypothetical protein